MWNRAQVVAVVVAVVAGLCWSAWFVVTVTRTYDVPLGEGLRRSMSVVDDTAATVSEGRELQRDPLNSDPEHLDALHNNHSLNDRSAHGYNDCDSWRNVIHDGWSAYYGVNLSFAESGDAAQLLARTGEHWRNQGHDVETQIVGDTFTRLSFVTDYAAFHLSVDTVRSSARIYATTHCLAPG